MCDLIKIVLFDRSFGVNRNILLLFFAIKNDHHSLNIEIQRENCSLDVEFYSKLFVSRSVLLVASYFLCINYIFSMYIIINIVRDELKWSDVRSPLQKMAEDCQN